MDVLRLECQLEGEPIKLIGLLESKNHRRTYTLKVEPGQVYETTRSLSRLNSARILLNGKPINSESLIDNYLKNLSEILEK